MRSFLFIVFVSAASAQLASGLQYSRDKLIDGLEALSQCSYMPNDVTVHVIGGAINVLLLQSREGMLTRGISGLQTTLT